jgi:DMSO/TMAO reductase YedYZ molybdopterin-dependent catalytic subunit
MEALDGPVTPNELFFVRNHFDTPQIDATTWRLKVEGCVERELTLSLDDLKSMAKTTVPSLLECAGNGRKSLDPPVPGLQWDSGAVGSTYWSGVAVSTVLEAAGLKDEMVDVAFEGADRGLVHNPPKPVGEIAYSRSIPRDVALSEGPILAYEMNGEPLPVSHGFPLRLLVPGWYAAASVKWLVRMVALDHKFMGYYETSDYSYWDMSGPLPELKPIGLMPVKSQIARPVNDEILKLGQRVEVSGAAWAGLNEVVKVEITVDGGQTWNEACFQTPYVKASWKLWSWIWTVDGPVGDREILCRATDSAGRVQDSERDWNTGTYVIVHSVPTRVKVTG